MTKIRVIPDTPSTTDLAFQAPANEDLNVYKFFYSLACDATVEDRIVQIFVEKRRPDNLMEPFYIGRSKAITASKQINICYGPIGPSSEPSDFMLGNPESDANEITVYVTGPPINLHNGERLVFRVDQGQAGDNHYGWFEVDSPPS